MKKRVSKSSQSVSTPKGLIIFLLSLVVLFGAVGCLVLIPYFNTLPVYANINVIYDISLITFETTLSPENTLTLTKNEDNLIFSSTDSSVEAGEVDGKYVFADRGLENSNVSMKFTYSTKEIRNLKFTVTVTNETGDHIEEINRKTLEYTKDEEGFITATYSSKRNIFIKKVLISYQQRAKN